MIHQVRIWILCTRSLVDKPVPLWIKSICSEHAYILATDPEGAWPVGCIVRRRGFSHMAHPRPRAEGDSHSRTCTLTMGRDEVRWRRSTPARWPTTGKMKTEAQGKRHPRYGRRAAGICDAGVEQYRTKRASSGSVRRIRAVRQVRRGGRWVGVERRARTGSGAPWKPVVSPNAFSVVSSCFDSREDVVSHRGNDFFHSYSLSLQ